MTDKQSTPLHTPGPWKVWESKRDNSVNVSAEADGAFVCEVGRIEREDYSAEVVRSDARLIAAAPDLLDALEDLVGLAEAAMREANNDGGEYDIEAELASARAAIKKARGE